MSAMVVDDPYGSGVRIPVASDSCDANGGDGVKATPASKDAIRKTLRDVISRDAMGSVQKLVHDIEGLSKLERLLLYLELPSSLTGIPDPLRQPLNPLGSRYEIQLTITWIKTHLEEDPQVSLPKHEVYDDYLEYCNHNGLKPLSTADFGKVMKQVYPQVRPRRLGTRGNSRYCYAGLKKKLKLEDPFTPEVCGDKTVRIPVDHDEEVGSAASFLIREWVEKLLGVKFDSLQDLALYLIEKMYVDNRSNAAHTVLAVSSKSEVKMEGGGRLVNGTNPGVDGLQDHKRKVDNQLSNEVPSKQHQQQQSSLVKRSKITSLSVDSPFSESMHKGIKLSPVHVGLDSDDFVTLSNSAANDFQQFESLHPPTGRTFLNHEFHDSSGKDDWDGPAPPPPPPPPPPSSVTNEGCQSVLVSQPPPLEPWEMDRKDCNNIDDELVTYFKDSSNETDENQTLKLSQLRQILVKNLKSPTSAFKPKQGNWSPFASDSSGPTRETENVATSAGNSLSSRRRVSFNPLIVQDTGGVIVTSSGDGVHHGNGNNGGNMLPSILGGGGAPGGPTLSGQSPGTRKRHFSFQPISPRQGSLPQSPSASPFISPRSTPVPTMRSRHSSGSALPLHLLPGGGPKGGGTGIMGIGGVLFNSSSSDISRAATFGSASECSTPFISPHGTPIPFNRSRHNSAQGRLCRSRHSSGLGGPAGPYRYNPAFSPMALNNLNNPYSPQPATPLGNHHDQDMFSAAMAHAFAQDHNSSGLIDPSGNMDPNRSRHSSAESSHDPNGLHVQSAPISPHCSVGGGLDPMDLGYDGGQCGGNDMSVGVVRHRHASAGNLPPSGSLSNVKPSDWLGVSDAVLTSDSQIVVGDVSGGYVTSSFGSDLGFHSAGVVVGAKKDLQDDLDIALSALKDCDNEYSKFVQDTENEDK